MVTFLFLDGEPQVSEYRHGASLPALEIGGAKAEAGGEFIGSAQDCFVWVGRCSQTSS